MPCHAMRRRVSFVCCVRCCFLKLLLIKFGAAERPPRGRLIQLCVCVCVCVCVSVCFFCPKNK